MQYDVFGTTKFELVYALSSFGNMFNTNLIHFEYSLSHQCTGAHFIVANLKAIQLATSFLNKISNTFSENSCARKMCHLLRAGYEDSIFS